jgi:TRAP-type C4-dicarboxylate transport system permease small subunit
MERVARLVDALATLFAVLGGAMVVLIALGVSVDVLTRNLTGRTVLNSFEFSTYLFAIAISFGMSYTALTGAHIRVDVLYARFPAPVRRVLDLASFVSLAALGVFLAWFSVKLTLASLARGVTSSSAVAFPLGLPQGVWAVGFVVFALTSLTLAARHAAYLVTGRLALADALGRFGQDEEIAEAVANARDLQGRA